jgi:hypothetical protein
MLQAPIEPQGMDYDCGACPECDTCDCDDPTLIHFMHSYCAELLDPRIP